MNKALIYFLKLLSLLPYRECTQRRSNLAYLEDGKNSVVKQPGCLAFPSDSDPGIKNSSCLAKVLKTVAISSGNKV